MARIFYLESLRPEKTKKKPQKYKINKNNGYIKTKK
jgi:hypothetical protein